MSFEADDDADSPLAVTRGTATTRAAPSAGATRTAAAAADQSPSDREHSYTEFYARLGAQEEQEEAEDTLPSRIEDVASRPSPASSQDLEASLLQRETGEDDAGVFGGLRRRALSRWPNLTTVAVVVGAFLLTVALLWWVSGGNRTHQPPNWKPANAYEVSFVMTLGSGLEEPGIAMVDQKQQKMRVSYYSGMTTYILNPNGSSWSVVPRIAALTCFEDPAGVQMQAIFPDMSRFKYVRQRDLYIKPRGAKAVRDGGDEDGKQKKKNRVACEEWVFRAPQAPVDGYLGTYTLWTLAGSSNVPVRFSFIGHNVILGASHYDNYTIDYYDYRDLSNEGGVDPFWLRPPYGMPCINLTDDSSGPTRASTHTRNWNLLFPEFEKERTDEYARFSLLQSRKKNSPQRQALFHQTLRHVEAHNRDGSKSYQLGINFMADWTPLERKQFARAGLKAQMLSDGKAPKSDCKVESLKDLLKELESAKLPNEVDHIENGHTLPPGDQGTCGSCWAFAATGAIEGAISRKMQRPAVGLSEQNLMDCSWLDPYENFACNGGLDYTAYMWAMQHNNGSIATEASYPFLNQDGFCHFDLKRHLVFGGAHSELGAPRITQCFHVSESFLNSSGLDGDELIHAFNLRLFTQGPLAVSIDASPDDFYFYKSGIYDNHACKNDTDSLDHAVLAVGYDLTAPVPFTRIRNNWGVWGEGGYARIAQKDNICGVATAPTYVEVD